MCRAHHTVTKMGEWDKLLLHSLVRGVVIGHLHSQHMFVYMHAQHYAHSSSVAAAKPFMEMANWQLAIFNGAGLLARIILLLKPSFAIPITYVGIALWMLGLLILSCITSDEPFATIEGITYIFISSGGGFYFWASLDDIIIISTSTKDHYAIRVFFGWFSQGYMLMTYWVFLGFWHFETEYLIIYPIVLLMTLPVIALLIQEELGATESAYTRKARLASGWRHLYSTVVAAFGSKFVYKLESRRLSFFIHLLFILTFSSYVFLPSMVLFFHRGRPAYENELLMYYRIAGTVVGETAFALFNHALSLPLIASCVTPIMLWFWTDNYYTFDVVAVTVALYGFCSGVLHVWVVHRVISHWLIDQNRMKLPLYLFLMALMVLPGSIIINPILSQLADANGVIHHADVLMLSTWLAIPTAVLVALHHFVYFYIEGADVCGSKHT